MCTDEAPGSESSATNQLCQDLTTLPDHDKQTTQPALQVIKVPSKKVYATVAFYISTHKPGDVLQRIVMEGVLSTDSEIAEESVALEGIRYMENLENVVVEDLNFSELKYVQEHNRDLQAKLEAAEEDNLAQRAGLRLPLTAMIGISHRMYDLSDEVHVDHMPIHFYLLWSSAKMAEVTFVNLGVLFLPLSKNWFVCLFKFTWFG